MTLKFSEMVLLTVLCKIKRNCISGLLCIRGFVLQICWSWVERNIFFMLWILTPPNQNEVIYSHNKC